MDYSILNEIDQKVIEISGYGGRRGFGKRPALLIVDVQNKFIGPDAPILEATKIYPIGIGERAHRALENIQEILKAARNKEIPIFYSVNTVPLDEMIFNSFAKKRVAYELDTTIPDDAEEIHDSIKPIDGEWVVHKRYASALFGTPLASFLNAVDCDTLIVVGYSTSGCIRAVSVDATSLNYNVVVAQDAVADRIEMSHNMALIDLNMKYADVIKSEEIINYINGLQQDIEKQDL